ncbi:MAG: SPFH domain-containing protein [Acidobacteriota bacterium]
MAGLERRQEVGLRLGQRPGRQVAAIIIVIEGNPLPHECILVDIQQALDTQTGTWGIKVSNVDIKQVDLTESMIRMITRQAEAERERRRQEDNDRLSPADGSGGAAVAENRERRG